MKTVFWPLRFSAAENGAGFMLRWPGIDHLLRHSATRHAGVDRPVPIGPCRYILWKPIGDSPGRSVSHPAASTAARTATSHPVHRRSAICAQCSGDRAYNHCLQMNCKSRRCMPALLTPGECGPGQDTMHAVLCEAIDQLRHRRNHSHRVTAATRHRYRI